MTCPCGLDWQECRKPHCPQGDYFKMNNEMIERVARAIYSPYKIQCTCKYCKRAYADAKAAIEAMREPTDQQRNNYYELSFKLHTFHDAYWERSIDAILKDS